MGAGIGMACLCCNSSPAAAESWSLRSEPVRAESVDERSVDLARSMAPMALKMPPSVES